MRRAAGPRSAAATALHGLAVLVVVVAPAAVLVLAGARAGLPTMLADLDLVAVSTGVGAAYAVVATRRLWRRTAQADSRADGWIAALNALSVLAVLASVLLAAVLHLLAAVQTPLAVQEWPLLVLWAAVQVTAVVLAESTERAVFAWLGARGRRRGGSTRPPRSARRRALSTAGSTAARPRRPREPAQPAGPRWARRATSSSRTGS